MLGSRQQAWLKDGLAHSRARWNIVAQQTLMAQYDRKPGPGQSFWTDGWDGYPAARARLLNDVAQSRASNPLVIGGDVHCTWVADLKPDFDDANSPTVATEFVGTAITSQLNRTQAQLEAMAGENPHIKYGNLTRRGYVRMELTPKQARADLRGVDSVTSRDAGVETMATFVVEDGRAGAQRA